MLICEHSEAQGLVVIPILRRRSCQAEQTWAAPAPHSPLLGSVGAADPPARVASEGDSDPPNEVAASARSSPRLAL